jgi:MSHA biogenesis protein MshI
VAMGEHGLSELAQELSGGNWSCPLAQGDYQIFVLPEPPVLESEMEASFRWSLASLVDYPVDEAILSWMRIPTHDELPGKEKQVYVIVARRTVVEQQQAMFRQAKVPLRAIDIRETALRNIAACVERQHEGLGLLTISEVGVTTTFTYRGELYLDRFIAQPLAEIRAADDEKKSKFLDRVAQQVRQSLELITRTYPFINVARIVVAPLPAPLPVVEHLARRLDLQVEALDLSTVFDLASVPQLQSAENQARYLFALGAALRGNGTAS